MYVRFMKGILFSLKELSNFCFFDFISLSKNYSGLLLVSIRLISLVK